MQSVYIPQSKVHSIGVNNLHKMFLTTVVYLTEHTSTGKSVKSRERATQGGCQAMESSSLRTYQKQQFMLCLAY
jgi:hypothetical protein